MSLSWKLLFLCFLAAGQAKRKRIINGFNANRGELPFQVSIQLSSGEHYCGGAIYNENYVITAAHCTKSTSEIQPKDIQVAVGLNVNKPDKIHKVLSIRRHEGYVLANSIPNDISLLEVSPPFVFNEKVSPVILPPPHMKIPPSTIAVISGWGTTTYPMLTMPVHLQKSNVTVISTDECQKLYQSKSKKLLSTHLCTFEPLGVERGPCNHDSGGPLTVDGKVLIGVISWGTRDPGCANEKYPNVYTRVSEYVDWIKENTISSPNAIVFPDD